jgi:hypothetical protein
MPTGNSYPAPNLPLNGTEQFTGFQQQGAVVATVTITISQLAASITAGSFSSPAPIGNITPNTGAFTFLTVTQFESLSTTSNVSAVGNTQGTATQLTTQMNVVIVAGSGSGVILPVVPVGTWVRVFHEAAGGNVLSVYPPVGHQIGTLGVNAPSGMIQNQANDYCFVGSNQWWIK